jgi:polyisoprenoid-binding protein YceI
MIKQLNGSKMKQKAILFLAVVLIAGFQGVAQEYNVLSEKSILRWTGQKITKSSHTGVIKLKQASFSIKNDQFVGGEFVIDMTTMVEGDGSEPEKGARLIGHLKSDDFFSVEKFPTATLKIKESTKFVKDEADVTGDLTIKGITHPIKFKVKRMGDVFQTKVSFDRSLYDVRFGSGKFFENLGNNAIEDMIPLDVTVVAVKK